MQTTREQLIEILQSMPGRKWQARNKPNDWFTPENQNLYRLLSLARDWEHWELRLAPEPKLRLIRADELPPVFWVRQTPCCDWSLCVALGSKGEKFWTARGLFYSEPYYFRNAAKEGWQYSATRQPGDIHSFMVPDETEGKE